MQAGRSTAKASKAMQEVMNPRPVQIGMRINVMPLARKVDVVDIKLRAPAEPMQKMAIEIARGSSPVHARPASLPTALSGA